MAVYCPKFDLLYIQNPCTASTAVGRFLIAHYGGIQVESQHTVLSNMKFRSKYNFCTVRNPYDKIASQYHKHALGEKNPYPKSKIYSWCFQNKPTFDEYIQAVLYDFSDDFEWWKYFKSSGRGSKKRYGDWAWIDGCNRFVHFESLQNDFDNLMLELGVENRHEIKMVNKTDGKVDYKSIHTEFTKLCVKHRYKDYLREIGYSFNGLVRIHL